MDTARTQLGKLLAGRLGDVAGALLDACLIEDDTLQIDELGLYRAVQAYWILNLPLFTGSSEVRTADIRCRWIDTDCHINELTLGSGPAGAHVDGTFQIAPCKKCGATFREVMAVEIEIVPPGICA